MNDDSYPRLSHADVQEFIDNVVRTGGDAHSVQHFCTVKQPEHAAKTDRTLLKVVEELLSDCGALRNSALEEVEARHCGPVFSAIDRQFGDEAIGDVEFWNYLAVRYFWEFVRFRQENAWLRAQGSPPSTADDDPDTEGAKLERYLHGKDHYQLPLRMYLRAQAVRDGDSFALADITGGSTDFWRSQVLGVRTAQFPPVARTVARLQAAAELNIEEQRPAGRRVNRLRANIDFTLHADDEAADVLTDLWRVTEDDRLRMIEKAATKKAATKKTAPAKKAAAKTAAPAKRAAAKRAAAE